MMERFTNFFAMFITLNWRNLFSMQDEKIRATFTICNAQKIYPSHLIFENYRHPSFSHILQYENYEYDILFHHWTSLWNIKESNILYIHLFGLLKHTISWYSIAMFNDGIKYHIHSSHIGGYEKWGVDSLKIKWEG